MSYGTEARNERKASRWGNRGQSVFCPRHNRIWSGIRLGTVGGRLPCPRCRTCGNHRSLRAFCPTQRCLFFDRQSTLRVIARVQVDADDRMLFHPHSRESMASPLKSSRLPSKTAPSVEHSRDFPNRQGRDRKKALPEPVISR